ncbi:MAG: hypothetical protein ACYSWW_24700, partial [Planctomycetota bacterium]
TPDGSGARVKFTFYDEQGREVYSHVKQSERRVTSIIHHPSSVVYRDARLSGFALLSYTHD